MTRTLLALALVFLFAWNAAGAGPFDLDLPTDPVPDRVSITRGIPANRKETWVDLDGPGCINHIWITLKHPLRSEMANRKIVLRIYFDGAAVPHVEAPVGDFFGVMHGVDSYPVNTPLLSVKEYSGYNCYFKMPFAKSARVEFETGDEGNHVYLQIDWHRYPEQPMVEQRRFCARWRKENPTQRYGEDFLMLDADGPGQLVGFVYGVRLIDNVDRWSHGGSENVYVDGEGDHPAYLRGIGGEDTFGTSYGGAHHPPETHLHAAIPYYHHEDTGEARRAQRLVGYRFFAADPILFRRSIHMRFGCMSNDICSTVYWYQVGRPRPFVKMPDWESLLPGKPLERGEMDLALPDRGAWWVKAPAADAKRGITEAISTRLDRKTPVEEEGWTMRRSDHGFVDFNHVDRPQRRGVGVHHRDVVGEARCIIRSPQATKAKIRLSWDERAVLRLGDDKPVDLGDHRYFRSKSIPVELHEGPNVLSITLSNTSGTNHGGWCFAFRCRTADGQVLLPEAR
ncbi:MAG: DUF2961 domain-containing protein [Planctomycetes bacterium]|nr:DUF2961 domain-containing protein [Planctomycetota bacterium]